MICTLVRHDKTLVIFLLLENKLYFIIILHNKDQLKSSHSLALYFIHHEMYIIWSLNQTEAVFYLQIALQFIPSTHRPRRKTLKSIVKPNCSLPLRIKQFRKSPFCWVQYLPLIFICSLSHSIFTPQMGLGWSEIRKSHQQIRDFQRFGVIWSIRWCLFVANVFIKKLTSICW